MASVFDKVALLRTCEFIVERLRRGCFLVGIAKFLRADFFVEQLVTASDLSVLQKLCFFNFDTLRFIIWLSILISFDFLWYKQKSVNQFSLYKLIIFISKAAIMFETFENQLLILYCQFSVRTITISVIIGLFVFSYFANGFSTLAISSEKRHLDVILLIACFILIVVYAIAYLSWIGVRFLDI